LSFKATIAEGGATLADIDILKSDWTSAGGEAAMRARLGKDEPLPEAFACANDQNGRRCDLRTARCRTACTEDVLVSGFDDITLTR